MRNRYSSVLIAATAAVGLLFVGGCLVVAAGAAAGTGFAYHKGELTALFNAPVADVARATRDALEEMNIVIISEQVSDLDASIVARTATDRRVKITAKMQGDNITRIAIRFGTFGDHQQSVVLHNRIRDKLEPA